MSLLNRLRKRAKDKAEKAQNTLSGRASALTETERAALGKPKEYELAVETELGVLTRRETFMFRDKKFGDMVFDVRGIKDAVLANSLAHGVFDMPMTQGFYEHLTSEGVETNRDYIAKMDPEAAEVPAIGIDWNDKTGSVTIIDGYHRLLWRHENGKKTFRLILVPLNYCRDYVMFDRLGDFDDYIRAEFATMAPPR